jgi:hypothetical protein
LRRERRCNSRWYHVNGRRNRDTKTGINSEGLRAGGVRFEDLGHPGPEDRDVAEMALAQRGVESQESSEPKHSEYPQSDCLIACSRVNARWLLQSHVLQWQR